MYKLHSLQHPDWYRTGTSYCYFYIFEIFHHDSVIFSKTYPSFLTVKEGVFLPLRLSCKESSTFLTKPLFNSLYAPFGSPSSGGQKPSGTRGCNRPQCYICPTCPSPAGGSLPYTQALNPYHWD